MSYPLTPALLARLLRQVDSMPSEHGLRGTLYAPHRGAGYEIEYMPPVGESAASSYEGRRRAAMHRMTDELAQLGARVRLTELGAIAIEGEIDDVTAPGWVEPARTYRQPATAPNAKLVGIVAYRAAVARMKEMAMREQKSYSFQATDATRESILLRAGFCGPTGSGKTKTGLILGTRMVERLGTGPLFVIDSENKSALRYAFSPRSRHGYKFKHVPMPEDDYSPAAYMAALDYCEAQGAGVILIDSLSHAWNGINGVLEQVDQVTERSRSKNQFSEGWKTMTPVQGRMIQRILGSSAHILFTLRAKVDWVMQENERGKKEPVKVGMAPIQREGIDYEPDLFFDMTVPGNDLVVSKSRCDRLAPGEVMKRPGQAFADVIIEWIEDSDAPGVARTLGEALSVAVAEGVAAAEQRSADRYKEAKRKLTAWCETSGVSAARHELALAQFKERVTAVAGPKATAATPEDRDRPAPVDELAAGQRKTARAIVAGVVDQDTARKAHSAIDALGALSEEEREALRDEIDAIQDAGDAT